MGWDGMKNTNKTPNRRPVGLTKRCVRLCCWPDRRKTTSSSRRIIMALRGKKPEAIQKRMKALFYGKAGVGKTTASIQFPRPYLIDTEKGAENDQYVKMLQDAGGAYFFTRDPQDLITEVTALLSEKHQYQTVIIDPLTPIYDALIEKGMELKGDEFGRYKTVSDPVVKHLLSLLVRLDMNVIITSHAKDRWVRSKDSRGKDVATQDGITFDCYPKLDYLFDLVFEVSKRGNDRVGIVRKTRMQSFPEGEIFPFCYNEIANRYGRDTLERDATPEVLATAEQVQNLQAMLDARKDGTELLEKWLDKAGAASLSELPADAAQKCIDYLMKGAVTNAA